MIHVAFRVQACCCNTKQIITLLYGWSEKGSATTINLSVQKTYIHTSASDGVYETKRPIIKAYLLSI